MTTTILTKEEADDALVLKVSAMAIRTFFDDGLDIDEVIPNFTTALDEAQGAAMIHGKRRWIMIEVTFP